MLRCAECGELIGATAEICPRCGVRQPAQLDYDYPASAAAGGVKVALLISAISNIVVGLFWMSFCFGVFFTIPMVVLCIFEFTLWTRADSLPPHELANQ